MTTTPTSIDNKTTKVKRLREDKFCVFFAFLLFGFCFMVGPFFYTFVKPRKKFISKNLIIIFKLRTIESFYYTQKDFATILVFLGSCCSPREIAKEQQKYI
jgi:hypothetical protein